MATMSGNIPVINALIDRRPDIVNQTDHEKHSLVHWAVVCCQSEYYPNSFW
jgi:ankyrin repeat protein